MHSAKSYFKRFVVKYGYNMDIPRPFLDERPWGEELWMCETPPSMVKLITVRPGQELSLQYHHKRDEFWHVISGNGIAVTGEEKRPLSTGSECFVPRGTKHRLETQTDTLVVLELAFGDFDESDIVRLEDKYGRYVS